jgi:thiazole synthase
MILELLKDPQQGGDPAFPVIVDAGVGTPSDVTMAMELGADGVLLNTGIAHARDPVRMAAAMKAGWEAGYHGFRAGRIDKKLYATASSPWQGLISPIPGE